MQRQGRNVRLYVQVNTGLEPQKAGIAPEDAAAFVRLCRDELALNIEGLMSFPRWTENPGPQLRLLAKLADQCGLSGSPWHVRRFRNGQSLRRHRRAG